MEPQLQPITNRDFKLPDDGWIQVAPLGEYPNPKAGIIQVVDKEAGEAMKNRFDEESKAENFPGLLLDFDHFSSDTKTPSTAAGWLEALENRADGLWAKVRWSTDGEAAVKGGNYRLVSPVWNRSQCESLGGNRFRPLRLDRAALTNDPVLKGMVPVSNRNGSADESNMVTREEMADAIAEAVKNAGTSAGAHKGWETRRGALSDYHDRQSRLFSGISKNNPSAAKMAAKHAEISANYKSKASVSGAKAHINRQLDALKRAKSGVKNSPLPLHSANKSASKPKAKIRIYSGPSGRVGVFQGSNGKHYIAEVDSDGSHQQREGSMSERSAHSAAREASISEEND